jgi:hypothetical protein
VARQGRGFIVANAVMLAAFAAFTAVQWNDPDPVRWMLMYGAAAAACACALYRAVPWPAAAAVGAVALVWGLTLAPGVLAEAPGARLFSPDGMMSPGVEEAREMLGLFIVAAWMAALVVAGRTS